MKILVLNSGSSSQKACLYEIGSTLPDHPPTCLWEGKVEFGGGTAAIAVKNSQGVTQKEQIQISSREQAVRRLLSTLRDGRVRALASVSEIDVVGHRVVHGGPHFEEPVTVTPRYARPLPAWPRLHRCIFAPKWRGWRLSRVFWDPFLRSPFSVPVFLA